MNARRILYCVRIHVRGFVPSIKEPRARTHTHSHTHSRQAGKQKVRDTEPPELTQDFHLLGLQPLEWS
jgi:hypothetical protein